MAEVNTEKKDNSKGKKPGVKKKSTRVDFTPMVDLGFLLITFFMLTTTLIRPQTMEISMPSRKKVSAEEETKVKASQAITLILSKENKVYYYFGTRIKGKDPDVIQTDFSPSGLRKILLQRNAEVVSNILDLKSKRDKSQLTEAEYKEKASQAKAAKSAPVVIIKATDEATYKNLVDALDEMQICNIARYAIVDITPYDMVLLKKTQPAQ